MGMKRIWLEDIHSLSIREVNVDVYFLDEDGNMYAWAAGRDEIEKLYSIVEEYEETQKEK